MQNGIQQITVGKALEGEQRTLGLDSDSSELPDLVFRHLLCIVLKTKYATRPLKNKGGHQVHSEVYKRPNATQTHDSSPASSQ